MEFYALGLAKWDFRAVRFELPFTATKLETGKVHVPVPSKRWVFGSTFCRIFEDDELFSSANQ
jgi:hypothetical protein